jgi:hypothetical protein
LVAPGQLAASPDPSKKRNRQKLFNPVAREVKAAAQEYHTTASVSPLRVPIRSMNGKRLNDSISNTEGDDEEAKSELFQENSVLR